MTKQYDVLRAKKIEQQVERWDLFAKIVPVVFLFCCFVMMIVGVDIDHIFYIGFTMFCITAVTWWFWAIVSIKFLVRLLGSTSQKLLDVGDELSSVKKEYQELRENEKDNRS